MSGRYDHTQEFDPVNSCNGGKDSTNAQKLTTMVHCQKRYRRRLSPLSTGLHFFAAFPDEGDRIDL